MSQTLRILVLALGLLLMRTVAASGADIQPVGPGEPGNRADVAALNDAGVVVGTLQRTAANGGVRAFTWADGLVTELPGGRLTNGEDVNNAGLVAGRLLPQTGPSRAVTWAPGASTPVELPWDGTMNARALGLNEAGTVVGGGGHPVGGGEVVEWPVLWPGPVTLEESENYSAAAYDVNAEGTALILPNSPDAPFLGGGGIHAARACLGKTLFGQALNDANVVVGKAASSASGAPQPVRAIDSQTCLPLTLLSGDTSGFAEAINNRGTAVGYSAAGATQRAVSWSAAGEVTDLNTLLPPNSGWTLTAAEDVNENEQIIGTGTLNGVQREFILTPESLTVNKADDGEDANPMDGRCDADPAAGSQCTLRAAIQEANAQPDADVIKFDVPGGAVNVTRALPEITATVELRGDSQPGGPPRIVAAPGGGYPGLVVAGEGSTLRSLVVGGFGSHGIVLRGTGKHLVLSSFVGTDPGGCGAKTGASCALGNGGAGILAESGGNRIGVESRPISSAIIVSEDRNVIANNLGAGVAIVGGVGTQAAGNSIADNGGIAIDLGGDGLTKNDQGDADAGPNGLLNAPVVTSQQSLLVTLEAPPPVNIVAAPGVQARALLQTTPGARVAIDAFADQGCPDEFAPEARTRVTEGFLGSFTAEGGTVSTAVGRIAGPPTTAVVFAATDVDGSTSELSNCFVDADADAINDYWERKGADTDRDGKPEVDLPALGASPRHKDLFAELDWMTGHALDDTALDGVRKAFADAPVTNLDGRTGIALHLDNGPGSVADVFTGAKWGKASRSEELPRTPTTGQAAPDNKFEGEYDWGPIDALAAEHLEPARRFFFHYSVAVERIAGIGDGVLGISRGIPGRDFIVGLQPLCPDATPCAGPPAVQAAAWMHELGHNLSLEHNGVGTTSQSNLKPNFFSLMNYLYVPGTLPTPEVPSLLDYSRIGTEASPGASGWVAALDENKLDEAAGFGARGRAIDASAAWICQPDAKRQTFLVKTKTRLSGPADWDCDGKIEKSLGPTDITYDSSTDPKTKERKYDPKFELLEPVSEWDKLNLRSGISGALGSVKLPLDNFSDLPAPLLEDILQAKAGDRRAPTLRLERAQPKRRAVRVIAIDDRRVDALELTLDGKVRTVRQKPRANAKRAKTLRVTLKVRKGRHRIRAVAYDGALRAKAKTLRVRVR